MKQSFDIGLEAPAAHAVPDILDEQRVALARRLRGATDKATREIVLEPLRAQTRGALRSRKLPTAWRSRTYPESASSASLAPAGFVWTQTPDLILAFDQGATIVPVNGARFLWIPTENAPVGRGGARANPHELARRIGAFGYAQGRNGTVVAYARVARRASRRRTKGAAKAPPKSRFVKPTRTDIANDRVEKVAFFVLVKQVTLRKRLDIAGVVTRARTAFPAALAAAAAATK